MNRFNISLGATQLRATQGTLDAKAIALGVTSRTISNYVSGARTPTDGIAGRIEREFGIPRAAWSQASPTGPVALPGVAPEATEASDESSSPGAPGGTSAIATIKTQAARLAAKRLAGKLSERAYLECEKLEATLARDLAKIQGITLEQIQDSPHFQAALARLSAALDRSPWALSLAYSALSDRPNYSAEMRVSLPDAVAAVEHAEAALLAAIETRNAGRKAVSL